MRDQVFISYSHRDTRWLERLQTMLKPLVRTGVLNVWADTQIQTGDKWRAEIQEALDNARVAVLLVSPDFLASDFVAEQELPSLLKAAEDDGLTIVWVPVRDSLYSETVIADYQAASDPSRPLAGLSAADRDEALVEISRKIMASTHAGGPSVSDAAATRAQPARTSTKAVRPPSPAKKVEPPAWGAPPRAQDNPAPAFSGQPALMLNDILPGTWRVQIQFSMPGAIGIMQLQMFPNGMFRGELTAPMGASMVEGMWRADPYQQTAPPPGPAERRLPVHPVWGDDPDHAARCETALGLLEHRGTDLVPEDRVGENRPRPLVVEVPVTVP